MARIFIEGTSTVNIDLLHEQLSAINAYEACSTHPSGVTVYFSGDVDLAGLQAIVSEHDGTALSTQESASFALKSEISTLKNAVGNIDNLTATEATSAIKLLYKVLRVNELI